MCGIAAHFRIKGEATPLQLSLLLHRGPDATGEWTSEDSRVWLGNTRLAIQDLSPAGSQPMIDPVSGNVIVFNGEIYNHKELRSQLYDPLNQWKGTSDTETLLAAYRTWGEGMLDRINGMFAFVLFDQRSRALFAARDRLGIKPIYYVIDDDGFRFSSEVKVLISGDTRPEPEALSAYLQWGACPQEAILFPGVLELAAGRWMRIESDGRFKIQRYWPPAVLGAKKLVQAVDNPRRKVRDLLEDAVRQHLLSDVPVASFLSGGIDSSIITALAARNYPGRLQTFSVGFEHKAFDETEVAQLVADSCRTDHHRIELSREEVIETIKEAVSKLDLPSVDAINTYVISKKVAQNGIKVALSGLGGDELFGGYPSFKQIGLLKLLAVLPHGIRSLLLVAPRIGSRLAELPHKGDTVTLARWRRRFWTNEMLQSAGLPVVPIRIAESPELLDDFGYVSWAELSGYMRHMLLRDADQMSMAVSLELRVPFLDHRFVEYVLSLSQDVKAGRSQPKRLLIEACGDLVPSEVLRRKKMGFALPMDRWMRGPLVSFVDQGLETLRCSNLLAAGAISTTFEGFRRNKIHWTRLWSLVVMGHFLNRNFQAAPGIQS